MATEIKDCRWPWNRLYIHVNGDIKPCCYATAPIGNVEKVKDYSSLWSGEEMSELRNFIEQGRIHKVCAGAGCAYIRSRMPTGHDLEKQAVYRVPEFPGITEHIRTLARLGQGPALLQIAHSLPRSDRAGPMGPRTSITWLTRNGRRLLWLYRAYRTGTPMASYFLALDLFMLNVRVADRFAFRVALESADNSYAPGCILLGRMYCEGRGCEVDPIKAAELFEKAAKLGEPLGFFLQGQILRWQPDKIDEARRLLKIAERRGVEGASEALLEIA